MNLSTVIFIIFNIGIGVYCLWRAHQILKNKRYDLVQRQYKQPFARPELVVEQVLSWNRIAGFGFLFIAVSVFVYYLFQYGSNPSFRMLLIIDQIAVIPLIIWQIFIVKKHDFLAGSKPIEEMSGAERGFAQARKILNSGQVLRATIISNTSEEEERMDSDISTRDNKFILQIDCQSKTKKSSTAMHEFLSLKELSIHLEKNTKLRFGDFN